MTLKIVHDSGDQYRVKYKFHWWTFYRAVKTYMCWSKVPSLNEFGGVRNRLFTYPEAEAFVLSHTEVSLRLLLATDRGTFDAEQARLRYEQAMYERKGLTVTK